MTNSHPQLHFCMRNLANAPSHIQGGILHPEQDGGHNRDHQIMSSMEK